MDENQSSKKTMIQISNDNMLATIVLAPPLEEEPYSIDEIMSILSDAGIEYGIKRDAIWGLIEKNQYNKEIVVAEGVKKENGRDGVYEFFFDTKRKPNMVIKEDGSIDFHNIQYFEPVFEGQVIAKYYKATNGRCGCDVKGAIHMAKPGKDLHALRGKFIKANSEGTVYTALISGKIELQNDKTICITPVRNIAGYVDCTVGNIYFDGDIVVQMDVLPGSIIEASGSVFVNGSVESATIIAGRDVVLRYGMQGGDRGLVIAGGRVMAKFFEATSVEAGGDINSNAIINCQMVSSETITVIGCFGAIVGGCVFAKRGIVASKIGNSSEIQTKVTVGITQKDYDRLHKLEDTCRQIENEICGLKEVISLFEDRAVRLLQTGQIVVEDLQRKRAADRLREKEVEMGKLKYCYESQKNEISEISNVELRVLIGIYKGTILHINAIEQRMHTIEEAVTIRSKGSDVLMYNKISGKFMDIK